MKNKNMCKFTGHSIIETNLRVLCFVQETDEATMKAPSVLTTNHLILCSEGSGSINVDGAKFALETGTLIFCFVGETIAIDECNDLIYQYIAFDGERARELFHRFDITPFSRIYCGLHGLIPLWKESLFRASAKTVELAAESMILYTFSRLCEQHFEDDNLMSRMIHYTEDNFKYPDLSISVIAQELSYNPKYLSHVFKSKAGINYSEYLRSIRLKYAITLFDHGIDSIKNVAFLSGFSDPLYFSNVFKKSVGISPKEYIDSKKKDS